MRPCEYFAPESVEEACTLLEMLDGGTKILAGGTDVLIELRKSGDDLPTDVIDISRISSLRGIEDAGDHVLIKPLTTHTELLRSKVVSAFAPLLQSAVSSIGSPQIRNRGTIGGNIMNAAACADTVPPLIALGATMTLRSARGERVVALSDFFVKPGGS